jgi:NAD(P)-dependent dehydrogenase (short-subunit alcohol dehydrogenase family)
MTSLGGNVVFTSRSIKSAEKAKREIEEYVKQEEAKKKMKSEGSVDFLVLNLNSFENVKEFVDEYTKKYHRIDVLVNNAGFFPNKIAISPPPFESGE